MSRRSLRSIASRNVIEISSSDSESGDSRTPKRLRTSSDIINSFLKRDYSTQPVSKFRKASDVINSFLGRKKLAKKANGSQLQSALEIINSHLRNGKFVNAKEINESESISTGTLLEKGRKIRKSSRASTSELKSDAALSKTRRKISESPTASSSQPNSGENFRQNRSKVCEPPITSISDRNPRTDGNAARKRRIEPSNTSISSNDEPVPQKRIRKDMTIRSASEDSSSRGSNELSSAATDPTLKILVRREITNAKTRATRTIETEKVIKGTRIPKEKYDRALEMLNSTECRYDETPVIFNCLPKPNCIDIRQNCNSRQHAEATYDTLKLGTFLPTSLTRIVVEMENCLKKEDWQQMAELIYFGCDLMKTEQSRRAIGTAFFTYTLLMLILDSSPSSISTMHGKREEIIKFLIALGGEPEESEEFLRELNFVSDVSDSIALNNFTIKTETI